jgi:putative ABC transport system ATP-binding protein
MGYVTADMTALLEAHDLFRFFHAGDHETLALRGVSLSVDAGEVVSVTGPSGSGKSTLLACLAGLDVPDGGMVVVDGHPMSRRSEVERATVRAENIGLLFQVGNLLEQFSVLENIEIAMRLARRVDRTRALKLLDQLGIAHRRAARPSHLSGGESARAGLAVSLANNPKIILADEPTGELDTAAAMTVLALLRSCADAGAAVVIVTHSPAAADAADREIRLLDGAVVAA